MYLWKLEIILNSGKAITCYDKNEYNNSGDVAEEFMAGSQNDIISLGDLHGTKNILIRKKEIAAMVISSGEEE